MGACQMAKALTSTAASAVPAEPDAPAAAPAATVVGLPAAPAANAAPAAPAATPLQHHVSLGNAIRRESLLHGGLSEKTAQLFNISQRLLTAGLVEPTRGPEASVRELIRMRSVRRDQRLLPEVQGQQPKRGQAIRQPRWSKGGEV